MDRSDYRAAFQREAASLAAAARRGLEVRVPSCPAWTVAALVTHITADVQAPRIKHVALRPRGEVIHSYADLDLPPDFETWVESERDDPRANRRDSCAG